MYQTVAAGGGLGIGLIGVVAGTTTVEQTGGPAGLALGTILAMTGIALALYIIISLALVVAGVVMRRRGVADAESPASA